MDHWQDDELRDLDAHLRRRQQRPKVPQKMAHALNRLLARRGYAQALSAGDFADKWRQAAGSHMAADSCAGQLRGGVLEITVRNSTVLQELNFQKKSILRRLRELVSADKIRDLRFRVGSLPDSAS